MPNQVRGLILFEMRLFFLTTVFLAIPALGFAQSLPAPVPVPEPGQILPETEIPEIEVPEVETDDVPEEDELLDLPGPDIAPEVTEPDYSKLPPKAEREARLQTLFEDLASRTDEESASLVAEEIWAIWLDSGSASVNLVLRRGSDAAAKARPKQARIFYNHTLDLAPDFAEGWARSARLALEQKDYNRALNEAIKALTLEPRHFYALWTMGNVFEALDRQDEALEAYREANRLYPELKAVKDRLATMEKEVEGSEI